MILSYCSALNVTSIVQYYLPPKRLISWPFIFKVLSGEKRLLKQAEIRISIVPPKIKHLQVKQIWSEIREDENVNCFFPDCCFDADPPRHYFFAVISTVRPDLLTSLLDRAEESYNRRQERMNNVVELHPKISTELNGVNWRFSLMSSKPDKRISFGPRN